MDRETLLDRLSRHRTLRHVRRPDLENLLRFASSRALAPRAKLFAAGEPGSAAYVVLSGWLKLSQPTETGRDMVLEVAGTGTLFGELSVLSNQPRAADAIALTACRLLAIDGRAFVGLLRQYPDALLEIIAGLGERLARTTTQMADTVFLPAEARLARALMRLAALDPIPAEAGLTIDLGLSQRELGELTGLTRESINKQFSAWRDAGLIELAAGKVILTDGAALGDIAEATGP